MLFRFWLLLAFVACGQSPATGSDGAAGDGNPGGPDAIVHVDDGTPTRSACTGNFGNALSMTYGRLDGFLVAIVPPGGGGCNADSDHVHLQVRANGAIYDVAVTVSSMQGTVSDVSTATHDLWIPAWQEGWHATGELLDYVSRGMHSTDFPATTKAAITSTLMTELSTVNHITVFATGYGPDGVHLVHRNGQGHDGSIVTEPLSSPAHGRMFRFSTQTF